MTASSSANFRTPVNPLPQPRHLLQSQALWASGPRRHSGRAGGRWDISFRAGLRARLAAIYRSSCGPPPGCSRHLGAALRFFMAGLALLGVALISPLGYLSTQYFSARIIQHMLLVASIPSFLMFANPVLALLYGLPGAWAVMILAA